MSSQICPGVGIPLHGLIIKFIDKAFVTQLSSLFRGSETFREKVLGFDGLSEGYDISRDT